MKGAGVTTMLDLLGAASLVAAAYLLSGPGLALAVAGLLFLAASWKASR